MKTNFIFQTGFVALALLWSCEQEVIQVQDKCEVDPSLCVVTPDCPATATAGSANFSKFVVIGNSLTSGFQAGALFNLGQANSLPVIMNKQFQCVGGSATFNQPDINSVNGYNSVLSDPGNGIILGRLILFDPDGAGPKSASPTPSGYPGVPAPYNSADLPGAYAGDKAALNNFSVPGIILAQALTPLTGGPSTGNPAYNPLYARFASNPGTSTILGDAAAAGGSFFLFWLGNNDVLGYAITGASGAIPITSESDFTTQYNGALNTLLGSNPNLKGVVGNIPDVTVIPFFTTVKYNAIPLDAATASAVNAGFAGYNQILDALKGPPFNYNAADVDARKITFAASATNKIVIKDETLNNYSDEFDILLGAAAITPEQRAALAPYEQVRQANQTDLITLSAGAVLGTTVGGNPLLVNGVSVPLGDEYVLIPSEITEIRARIAAFNGIISAAVAGTDRVALADINATYTALVTAKAVIANGVTITPSLAPPTAGFSEDGVHPNSRGYAYLANVFIDAINTKFGASVPKANVAKYSGTGLPVNP